MIRRPLYIPRSLTLEEKGKRARGISEKRYVSVKVEKEEKPLFVNDTLIAQPAAFVGGSNARSQRSSSAQKRPSLASCKPTQIECSAGALAAANRVVEQSDYGNDTANKNTYPSGRTRRRTLQHGARSSDSSLAREVQTREMAS